MTLQRFLLHILIWGKFSFLFYQCRGTVLTLKRWTGRSFASKSSLKNNLKTGIDVHVIKINTGYAKIFILPIVLGRTIIILPATLDLPGTPTYSRVQQGYTKQAPLHHTAHHTGLAGHSNLQQGTTGLHFISSATFSRTIIILPTTMDLPGTPTYSRVQQG